MANSLFPAFVLINYHSAYGTHKMIRPTRAWQPTNITGTIGSYTAWDGSQVDAEVMVNNLVSAMQPFFLTTTSFDDVTVYTLASTSAPALPQASVSLAVAGTSTAVTQAKATESTYSFKDTAFNKGSINLLDAPVNVGFAKKTPSAFSSEDHALEDAFISVLAAWSTRAGFRPKDLIKVTYDLNDKLRREYGMT